MPAQAACPARPASAARIPTNWTKRNWTARRRCRIMSRRQKRTPGRPRSAQRKSRWSRRHRRPTSPTRIGQAIIDGVRRPFSYQSTLFRCPPLSCLPRPAWTACTFTTATTAGPACIFRAWWWIVRSKTTWSTSRTPATCRRAVVSSRSFTLRRSSGRPPCRTNRQKTHAASRW